MLVKVSITVPKLQSCDEGREKNFYIRRDCFVHFTLSLCRVFFFPFDYVAWSSFSLTKNTVGHSCKWPTPFILIFTSSNICEQKIVFW